MERRSVAVGLGEVVVAAADEAEEFVEAAAVGMEMRSFAEVPLADHAGVVTRGLELIADGFFAERQAALVVGVHRPFRVPIDIVSEARLRTACDETGAARRAHRGGDITGGAAHAILGEAVDVGRRDILRSLDAEIGEALVVG